jgi:biopolymer transport protein TolR
MARARRRAIAEINVVPYIDVMLVLLIVFMVTAPLITQGLGIKLPEADAQTLPQQEEPLVVSLNKDGQYFFNIHQDPQSPLPLADIQDRLRKIVQNRPNVQVLIEGDGDVAYRGIINLMRALQSTGVKEVGLLTDPVLLEAS